MPLFLKTPLKTIRKNLVTKAGGTINMGFTFN